MDSIQLGCFLRLDLQSVLLARYLDGVVREQQACSHQEGVWLPWTAYRSCRTPVLSEEHGSAQWLAVHPRSLYVKSCPALCRQEYVQDEIGGDQGLIACFGLFVPCSKYAVFPHSLFLTESLRGEELDTTIRFYIDCESK